MKSLIRYEYSDSTDSGIEFKEIEFTKQVGPGGNVIYDNVVKRIYLTKEKYKELLVRRDELIKKEIKPNPFLNFIKEFYENKPEYFI